MLGLIQWKGNFKAIQKDQVLVKKLTGKLLATVQKRKVGMVNDTIPNERISFLHCDNDRHHVTEPARVHEVEVIQVVLPVVIVQ